jgi:hypothetical protein
MLRPSVSISIECILIQVDILLLSVTVMMAFNSFVNMH